MFHPTNNFLVKFNLKRSNLLTLKNEKGEDVPLTIDDDFNKYNYSVQVAEIVAIPNRLKQEYMPINEYKHYRGGIVPENPRDRVPIKYDYSQPLYRYDLPLDIGDNIIIHHMVDDRRNQFSEDNTLYWCNYNQIWGKLLANGDVIPTEDWLFLIPIQTRIDGFLTNFEQVSTDKINNPDMVAIKRKLESYYIKYGAHPDKYRKEIRQLEQQAEALHYETHVKPEIKEAKFEKRKGILKFFNPHFDYCLKKGMELLIVKDANYLMVLNGETLIRCKYNYVDGNF